MTDRENDLQDNDISNLLDNMDEKEMARLEQWFMAKNGLSNGSGAPAPPAGPGAPPPPPPPGPEVKIMLRVGNTEINFFETKILSRPPRTDFSPSVHLGRN